MQQIAKVQTKANCPLEAHNGRTPKVVSIKMETWSIVLRVGNRLDVWALIFVILTELACTTTGPMSRSYKEESLYGCRRTLANPTLMIQTWALDEYVDAGWTIIFLNKAKHTAPLRPVNCISIFQLPRFLKGVRSGFMNKTRHQTLKLKQKLAV